MTAWSECQFNAAVHAGKVPQLVPRLRRACMLSASPVEMGVAGKTRRIFKLI